ncbi:Transposable element P transposase [Dissostichus eleginoides]|uniref:Transposable element P transposase n=1 Tax=Dissostichus eleginoides TaxID=100907 RepID=A0AAD9FBG5_DISEL|nr:Transposable element P transposase [Dissostichus eleginoides]
MLRLKADGMSEMEKKCVLTLDEMSITPSVELHLGNREAVWEHNTTWPQRPGHSCLSVHAGWCYYAVETAAASIGLHVVNITTDMGSPNRAMWKSFWVTYAKPWTAHPVKPHQHLYFMPDVPHVVKNLKSALVNGHVITIPQDVVDKEKLPSSVVSVGPLKDLVSYQEGMALKLAPKLSRGVLEPSHFEKMKVSSAMHVFSKSSSAALRYMVAEEHRPESYLTTAWFLDHWFDLMSSRNTVTALSHFKMEEYDKAIIFLRDSIHLFRGLKIGPKGSWKPVQTGLVMATTTILEVQHDLLRQGHKFVLTSRFTQDCLENTFSSIRLRNSVPTPVEFQSALRAVTVGQFLSPVHTGSYVEDGSDHLADFLDTQNSSCSPPDVLRVEQLVDLTTPPDITKTEAL